jgi:hypothetical protein
VVVSFVVVVAGGDVGDCGCDYTIDCAVPFFLFFPCVWLPRSFVRADLPLMLVPNYTTPRP